MDLREEHYHIWAKDFERTRRPRFGRQCHSSGRWLERANYLDPAIFKETRPRIYVSHCFVTLPQWSTEPDEEKWQRIDDMQRKIATGYDIVASFNNYELILSIFRDDDLRDRPYRNNMNGGRLHCIFLTDGTAFGDPDDPLIGVDVGDYDAVMRAIKPHRTRKAINHDTLEGGVS